ncbi:MAG: hypothetical protein DCC75_13240 [Proteobacteria bacterium]|nr:MAG: hypothetical protein DCC75_13240 [Pseudomonadota bacterium]
MTESFSVKFQGDRYMTRSALAPGIAYLHLRDSEMASEYFGELVSGLNERLGANSAHPLIATARAYCLVAAISSIGNLDRKGSDGVRQAKPLLERLDRELEDNNIAYPHLAELAILRASLPLCAPGLFELEGPVGPQLIREVADDLEDVIECIAVECGTRHQLYGRAAYLQARLLTEITDDYNESLRLLKRFELAAEAYIEAFGGCHSTSQSIMSLLVVNCKQLNQPQRAGDWERRRYESLADDSHYQ